MISLMNLVSWMLLSRYSLPSTYIAWTISFFACLISFHLHWLALLRICSNWSSKSISCTVPSHFQFVIFIFYLLCSISAIHSLSARVSPLFITVRFHLSSSLVCPCHSLVVRPSSSAIILFSLNMSDCQSPVVRSSFDYRDDRLRLTSSFSPPIFLDRGESVRRWFFIFLATNYPL